MESAPDEYVYQPRRRAGELTTDANRRRVRPIRVGGAVIAIAGLALLGVGAWGVSTYRHVERVSVQVDAASAGDPENWLVVGSDARDAVDENEPELGGDEGVEGRRSDSMMVARLDPETREVSVLAIPRDLLVTLPDGREGRINGAYNDGPQAVIDTIEESLDLPIHHYAEVNFSAFEAIVDELDGIPVRFDRPVRDTHSGLDIESAGCHVLDGRSALAFARSRTLRYLDDDGRWRTDPTGDLGRISRQQYLIGRSVAMAGQLGLTRLGSIRSIVDVVARHVALDDSLGVADLVSLARRFGAVDLADLETTAIPTVPHVTDAGADVLLVDEDSADAVLAPFRGDDVPAESPNPTEATSTTTTTMPPMVAGTVELVNASGVDGAARAVADALARSGAEIGQLATAVDLVDETVVATGSEATDLAAAVSARLGGAEVEMDDNLAPSTVRVVLADDRHLSAGQEASWDPSSTVGGGPSDTTVDGAGSGTTQAAATPTSTTTTVVGWVPPDSSSATVCR